MRGWRRTALLLLIPVVAGLLVWSARRDDGVQSSRPQAAQIRTAVDVHNASFAPSRETLRAWALFDDVRCAFNVASGAPSRVLLGATLGSGNWFLIYIDADEVDYDSYREGSSLDQLKTEIDDVDRFFSRGAPCSVREGGDLSSP